MNHLFIVLISLTFFIAKSCPGQTTFPDSIPFGNTETTSRLKGTRVFLKIPASYKVRDKAIGYQDFIKDSMTGLQVVENIFDNFYQLKNEVVKDLGKKINGGTGTSKTVKIGSYDGIYYTGPFKMPEQKSVLLIFGDSSFAVMIYGGFQSTDKVSEIELNTILKSTGYKKSWILNPLELPGIQFEEGITGFKYIPDFGASSISYSVDGVRNSAEDKSSFEIGAYKSTNIEREKKILKQKVKRLTEFSSSKLNNVHYKNIIINGNQAYELIMEEHGPEIVGTKFYIVIIQKENKAVRFWGVDRDNGKWVEKYKSTVQSIKW